MEQQPHQYLHLDRDMAAEFIGALTGSADTIVTFQTFPDAGDSELQPSFFHASVRDAWERLCEAQDRGHGVFMMVNEGDLAGRSSANVRALRALFADADDESVPVERLANPSIIVRSGNGEHYYWLLNRGEALDAFTRSQKGIATFLGTDPKVCDLGRVMRLPGTYNLKDRSNPRRVELVKADGERRLSVHEVMAALGALPAASDLIDSTRVTAAPGAQVLASEARFRAEQYIAKIRAVAGAHGDNATFRAACVLLKDFAVDHPTAWDALKTWNLTNAEPPWSEAELAEKFWNADKYGVRQFGAALQRPAANEPMRGADPEERVRLITSRWRPLSVEILEEPPPVKDFVWENAIPVGDVGTLVGPGAAGKSATLVGLAVHMALGLPFLGRKTRHCPTVIVSLEDNFDDYRRKLAAWRDALGPAWNSGKVAAHVFPIDLRGTDVRLVRQAGREYAPSFDGRALAEVVKYRAPGVGLIVIETASRCGGDESNPAMSALISAAEEVSAETGAAVVIVAHVSKAAAREGNGDQHAARGGAAISDNGRFSITATLATNDQNAGVATVDARTKENLITLRVAKINCAPTNTIGVVERRGSRYQTVTVALFDGAASAEESRWRTGAGLRAVIERLTAAGGVTRTTLKEEHAGELVPLGVTTRGISAAVDQAIVDGFLVEEPRNERGGGTWLRPAIAAGVGGGR